jgi:hypothetical protein
MIAKRSKTGNKGKRFPPGAKHGEECRYELWTPAGLRGGRRQFSLAVS